MNQNHEIKIGVCSWSFWQNLDEQLHFLAENGFTSTSLLQHAMKLPLEEKLKCAELIQKYQLRTTFHSNVLFEHLLPDESINQNYIDALYDEVLWWHEHLEEGIYSACSDANLKQVCVAHLNYMKKRLAPHGIRFGLENTCLRSERKYFCHIDQMDEIYREAEADPLRGFLIDAGHLNVCCNTYHYDMEEFLLSMPEGPIWEVHLCDNYGKNDDHLPLGEGTLPLKKFFHALKEKKFQGVFTYESLRKRDRQAFDLNEVIDRQALLDYKKLIEDSWADA